MSVEIPIRCPDQPRLYNSLRKYGAENHQFKIVAWFTTPITQSVLDERECELIALLKLQGVELLNILAGGHGSTHTEETKRKIGEANRGNKRPDLAAYNRKFKAEQMRGARHSDETKKKIGLAHKGNTWSKGRIQSESERRMRSELATRQWAERKARG